jgi:hypothetical protein
MESTSVTVPGVEPVVAPAVPPLTEPVTFAVATSLEAVVVELSAKVKVPVADVKPKLATVAVDAYFNVLAALDAATVTV